MEGSGQWWIYFGWWCVVVGPFWVVVGDGGFILGVVDGGRYFSGGSG